MNIIKNNKIKIGIYSVLFVLIYLFSFSNVKALEYNANEWSTFKNRTKEEIGMEYSKALTTGVGDYRDGKSASYYSVSPNLKSPYVAGQIKPEVHTVMTNMSNYYRWLVGVNKFKRVSTTGYNLQEQALLRNFQFDHYISFENMPKDMKKTDNVWVKGSSVNHNIIARGYTPRGSIVGWFNEGYVLSESDFDDNLIGHRQAILGAKHSEMDYGFSGAVAIGRNGKNENNFNNPFVAFPAPGLMPNNVTLIGTSVWSVELDTTKIWNANTNNISVKVTDLKNNSSYVCTLANGKLKMYSSSTIMFVQPKSGDRTSGYYSDGDKFKVEITGLRDSSGDAKITYTTEFFDVKEYSDSFVTGYKINNYFSRLKIAKNYNDITRLTQISKILPKEIIVTTESGRKVTIPTVGDWTVDMKNNCFKSSVDLSKLPSSLIDRDNLLSDIKVYYDIEDYTGSFRITPSPIKVGNPGEMYVHHYMTGTKASKIYQITADGKVKERFNEKSSNHTFVDNGYGSKGNDSFAISSFTANDNGTYINLYYNDEYDYGSAYISGIIDINVVEAAIQKISMYALPYKRTYIVGEDWDVSGGSIVVNYDDNTSNYINLTKNMVIPTASKEGKGKVGITYGGKETSFDVLVINGVDPINAEAGKKLSDYSLPKSEYGTYSWVDGDTELNAAGSFKYKVKFTPSGSTSYLYSTRTDIDVVVNVKAKTVSSATVTRPTKTTYKRGTTSSLDLTGGKINLVYSDNTKASFKLTEDMITNKLGNPDTDSVITVKFAFNKDTAHEVSVDLLIVDNPTQVEASEGQKLSEVGLPAHSLGVYSWDEAASTLVGTAGKKSFKVKFKPNSSKYSELTGLAGSVNVVEGIPSKLYLSVDYGKKLSDVKLPSHSLGTYCFEQPLTDSVGDAGVNESDFTVMFTPDDLTKYQIVRNIPVVLTVNKINPTYSTISTRTAVYGQTLSEIALPSDNNGKFSWNDASQKVGNVGTNKFKVTFTPTDTKNYNVIDNISVNVKVSKADPDCEIPTGIKVEFDKKLKDIKLPKGFKWKYENTSVGGVGTRSFVAIYTPEDTDNYNIIEVQIEIKVTKKMPNYTVPTGLTATYGQTLKDVKLPSGFTFNNSLDTPVGNAGVNKFKVTYDSKDDNYEIIDDIEVEIKVKKKVADKVSLPVIEEITYDPDTTLADIELGERWSWDDESIVPTVGNSGYKATYTPVDSVNYDYSGQDLNPTISITVNKAIPSYVIPTLMSYSNKTLADVVLPEGFSWQLGLNTPVGSVGSNPFMVTYTPSDTNNYEVVRNIEVIIEVDKAYPEFTIPTGLEATYGDLISSIELPSDDNGVFTWNKPNSLVGNAGNRAIYATYTPNDTDNYAVVRDVKIIVKVNKKKANPIEIPVLGEIDYNPNFKLSNISLPKGWKWDNGEIVPTVNVRCYRATYTPSDANNFDYSDQDLNPMLDLKVNKVNPIYKIPALITVEWGTSLKNARLPIGYSFQADGKTGEIGFYDNYLFTYTPVDSVNYNIIRDIPIRVEVVKATPVIDIKDEIIIKKKAGLKLKDIKLDEGWNWSNPEELVGNGGLFEAFYKPIDLEHYRILYKQIVLSFELEAPINSGSFASPMVAANENNTTVDAANTSKDDNTLTVAKDKNKDDKKKDDNGDEDDDDDEDEDDDEVKSYKTSPWVIVIIMAVLIAMVIGFSKIKDND